MLLIVSAKKKVSIMLNQVEHARLEVVIAKLLNAVPSNVAGVRSKLSELFEEAKTNTTRARRFDRVSDLLTGTQFCKVNGEWVIAEVEGDNVQFNRLID